MAALTDFAYLGVGFNTFEKKKASSLLKNISNVASQEDSFVHIRVCQDTEDIHDSLNISASASISAGGFEADSRLDFAQDITKSTNAVTILIVAQRARTGELTQASFENDSLTGLQLYQQGGDSYIKKVTEGAMYMAAYQFLFSTVEEKRDIASKTNASYSGASVAVKGELEVKLGHLRNSSHTQTNFFESSMGYKGAMPNKDNLENFAFEFGTKKEDLGAPAMLFMETESYSTISGCPSDFARTNRFAKAYKKVVPDWGYGHSLAKIESQAIQTLSKVQAVQTVYRFYDSEFVEPNFAAAATALTKIKDTIANWRNGFDPQSLDETIPKPILDLNALKIPVANFNLVGNQQYGRNGGSQFNDVTDEMINQLVYPKKITIEAGNFVYRLKTLYAFRDPKAHWDEGKEKTKEISHCKATGSSESNGGMLLKPNEVTQINMWMCCTKRHWDNSISGFQIRTKNGGFGEWRTDATFSDDWNSPDYFPPPNGRFVGWKGRSADYLDALGPVWVVFDKPRWEEVSWADER